MPHCTLASMAQATFFVQSSCKIAHNLARIHDNYNWDNITVIVVAMYLEYKSATQLTQNGNLGRFWQLNCSDAPHTPNNVFITPSGFIPSK